MPEAHHNPSRSNIVIGLTGPFGSGCSTLRKVLKEQFDFREFMISDDIRKEVKADSKFVEKGKTGWRKALQEHGNKKRNGDEGYWVKKVLERIDTSSIGDKNIVIDGFRNVHEVEVIRSVYPRFFLVAVYAEKKERWERVKKDYEGRYNEFEEDDQRDKLEEFEWGQSVQKCVDDADYAFYNNEQYFICDQGQDAPALEKINRIMKTQADDFVPLMKGNSGIARNPKPEEVQIAAAYAQSNSSTCKKRHVGAVIVISRNSKDFPISMGFNENPPNIKTCLEEGGCYKDEDMASKLSAKKKIYCLKCGKLYDSLTKPWICECGASFKEWLHPNRNMELCTAIHAEERAILSLGNRIVENGTLYVTTFPCFQCARLIIDSGINKVIFVEAYPVRETKRFLEANGVKVLPFTGFTAKAFFKVFRKVN
jgi:deoxycytidylate deaminase/dephospho-CoA kinase